MVVYFCRTGWSQTFCDHSYIRSIFNVRGVWDHFFLRSFCSVQTVPTLSRLHILSDLIWFYSVGLNNPSGNLWNIFSEISGIHPMSLLRKTNYFFLLSFTTCPFDKSWPLGLSKTGHQDFWITTLLLTSFCYCSPYLLLENVKVVR